MNPIPHDALASSPRFHALERSIAWNAAAREDGA
jgi:hypothetical protein